MDQHQLLQDLKGAMDASGYAPEVVVVVRPWRFESNSEIFKITIPELLMQFVGGLDPLNIVYIGTDRGKAERIHNSLVKTYTHIKGILAVSSESTDDDEDDEADSTVECSICHEQTDAMTAHRHQDRWIGECCWDERLRASE